MASQPSSNGFFGALFDFSFSEFVTTRIIKVLYVLAVIGVTLWSLAILFAGVTRGGGEAVLALLFAVLAFLLGIVYSRVLLEFIVIVFRIAEHTRIIAANTATGTTPTPPASGPSFGSEPPPPPPA